MDPLPRVVSAERAARLGFTPARVRTELRRGRWQRLAAGVLLTRPDEPSRDDWIMVGMILGGAEAALSGWDAIRLRGLRCAQPPGSRVLVLTDSRRRNRDIRGLHLRPSLRPVTCTRLSPFDQRLPSIRVVSPARAIADTAPFYDRLQPVRALVTSAVQRGLCTPAELAAELAAGPRNGSAFFRRALSDVVEGALSIAEAEVVDLLAGVSVPPFEVNAPIYDAHGNLLYRVDFLWRALQAVVEVDSREFHFAEDDWKRTMQRHNVLTAMGYAVTHYAPSVIRARKRAWATDVAAWLAARSRDIA
ncbi:MAG: hypothetical protein ABR571_04480 [Jatrophihabitans sp.]|uniref:hypothetical protein n=1 Tax=Jatrophihabitans sp. TaxID=1932789 RepID=UPI003914F740